MSRGEGPGWHRESRRHHDAAMQGRPTHDAQGKRKFPAEQHHDLTLYRIEQLEYDLQRRWPSMTEDQRNEVMIAMEVLVSTFYDSAHEGKRVQAEDWKDNTSKGPQRKVDNVYAYISERWYKMTPAQRKDVAENLDEMMMDIEALRAGEEPVYQPTAQSVSAMMRKAYRLDGPPPKRSALLPDPRRS